MSKQLIRALVAVSLASLALPTFLPTAEGQPVPAACSAPPSILTSTAPNIFNEQQEQWLGDAMADELERRYVPAKDLAENAYLERIGERLLAVLPPTKIKFHFVLVDSVEINGFSMAGGRVYITRKLVANAHNEDEVAGVIAHEMGHILSHQFAIETTADMKRLLGVTGVGDRADIYAKFQQLMDARMKTGHSSSADTDEKQDEADRVSVYATAAAGYWPQAYADFWNRAFYVDGKVGGRLSDFFGTTKPDSKRLRSILKLVNAIPAGCGSTAPTANVQFSQWQTRVVANQAVEREPLTKPLAAVALTPPLRMDLERLRFSRDGKSILAQDESSVFVMSRDPFKMLFRFDATDSMPAEFSPDSQHIVFHTPGLHTEEWSVQTQKLVAAHEPVARHDCLQTKLSPDGRTLVCISWNEDRTFLNLALLDVESGAVLFEKKPFFEPTYLFNLMLYFNRGSTQEFLPASFSADGNTLLIGPGNSKLAFDLRTRTPIKLNGDLKNKITGAFAFEGNDKVAGISIDHPDDSGVFSFPDGKRLLKTKLQLDNLGSVTKGDYVIVRGEKKFAAGIGDLAADKILAASTSPALDVWDNVAVNENKDGSVLLLNFAGTGQTQHERISLPVSPLGRPEVARLSPDGKYLVLSTRTRGAVWDLTTGKQLYLLRGFTSASFGTDGMLYAELPKQEDQERTLIQISLSTHSARKVDYVEDEKTHLEDGRLLEWKSSGKNNWELVVHDVVNNSALWTKEFERDQPGYTSNYGGAEMIFSWKLNSTAGKAEQKKKTALATEAAAVKDKDAGRLIEVVDDTTGKLAGAVVVEVPARYEGVGGVSRVGDLLYVSSADNRTMLYSMETGKQIRQIFGYVVAVDTDSKRICIVNRPDEAIVYDNDGAEVAHFNLGSQLRFATFEQKGAHLVLLTADQKVQTMDLTSALTFPPTK